MAKFAKVKLLFLLARSHFVLQKSEVEGTCHATRLSIAEGGLIEEVTTMERLRTWRKTARKSSVCSDPNVTQL